MAAASALYTLNEPGRLIRAGKSSPDADRIKLDPRASVSMAEADAPLRVFAQVEKPYTGFPVAARKYTDAGSSSFTTPNEGMIRPFFP